MSRYAAVIFDLDGTLVETERVVIEAGLAAFARIGHPERLDLLHGLVGLSPGPASDAVFDLHMPDPAHRAAFEAAWDEETKRLFAEDVPPRPGALELLTALQTAGIPRAVATNSRTASALESLAEADLLPFFSPDHVFGRDRVTAPKPAPDLFLNAAAALGAKPAACLAFEDSDPGTEAALAAGMTVVQVPDLRPAGTLRAHFRADSLLAGARAAGLI